MSQGIDPRILSTLANFDMAVHQHRSAIAAGRKRERDLGQLETEYAAEAAERRARVDELKTANKKLEAENEETHRQAKLHQGRLNEIQDTREWRALNDEVRYLRRQIENREETMLANMELLEKAEAEYETARAELEAKLKEINGERARIETERAENETGMAAAQKNLARFLEQIPDTVARFYQRRAARQEMPVVWMDKDACGSCHQLLPPQQRLEVLKADRLVTCHTCGRIIVASNQIQDSSVS